MWSHIRETDIFIHANSEWSRFWRCFDYRGDFGLFYSSMQKYDIIWTDCPWISRSIETWDNFCVCIPSLHPAIMTALNPSNHVVQKCVLSGCFIHNAYYCIVSDKRPEKKHRDKTRCEAASRKTNKGSMLSYSEYSKKWHPLNNDMRQANRQPFVFSKSNMSCRKMEE